MSIKTNERTKPVLRTKGLDDRRTRGREGRRTGGREGLRTGEQDGWRAGGAGRPAAADSAKVSTKGHTATLQLEWKGLEFNTYDTNAKHNESL